MAIAVTHFIADEEPLKYHAKRKDISDDGKEFLLLVEKYYNKMMHNDSTPVKLIPVLPNLVTSTDKLTMFATASIVNDKDEFYIVSKPTAVKNKKVDSGSHNHYKHKPSGDAHCRGVCIIVNSTFTAG